MIAVSRASGRLVVSQGPGASRRLLVALAALGTLGGAPFAAAQGSWGPLLLGVPLVALAALLAGWRTTELRFDAATGVLAVRGRSPLRPTSARELPLTAVAGLVDRRWAGLRAIELALDDRSSLPVARGRPGDPALEQVARELTTLLGLPLRLGEGLLVAGRFQIERQVAEGGMGVVYRALDRTTGQPVALKLLLRAEDADRERRFAREIRLLAEIDHPRIARYIDHGQDDEGRTFLAMQWLDGHDLSVALGSGPLSHADALRVLMGAAEALAAVHAQGVVHRDLKPGNLFLRGRSPADVVLLDFGVARRLEAATQLTGKAALLGTPHYMAPEQVASAAELGPAADVFSLGCVFYECLSGRRPFEARQLLGVLARILHDAPPPVHTIAPAVPEPWSRLVERMLAKDPADRPADGAALVRELALLPPASAEAPPRRALTAETAPSDQVLVGVVLVTPAAARPPEETALAALRSALDRFGCPVERLADGSLLATVLPRPSATDLARIAARCAIYLREQLPDARIAVATGRAPLGPGPRIGDAVDRAAQLLDGTIPGDAIRLDPVTRGLLDARFLTASHRDIDLLVGEDPALDESRPLLGKPTPCVGRDLELAQLEALMAAAVEERAPRAAVVIGPPGIGKSRLRHELLRRLRDRYPEAVVLVGYGDPLTAGSPLAILADALRRRAGVHLGDASATAHAAVVEQLGRHLEAAHQTRVAAFLGELCGIPFPDDQNPPLRAARGDHRVMSEQIGMAFLDWLGAECAAHPVVLVLEDLQWGDALTVRLLESALRELVRGPLLLVALARPELDAHFPRLFGEHRSLSLALGPLSDRASARLVEEVLGESVDAAATAHLVRLAAGNALFLEELIRAAAEGKAGDVPGTVLAMLQARLSRLAPEARLVLRAASVLGETFWRGGVARIGERWGFREDPQPWLDQLVALELVARLRTSRFPGDAEYTFRHGLVRDAAAGLSTDEDARAGHLAAAGWLEAAGEQDGIVLARHAESGGDRARAIGHYVRAAQQSLGRHDARETLARATRGIACGAEGEALGRLRAVQSAAHYSLASWAEAAEAGQSALPLLPRGGPAWCETVERLMHVLPVLGAFARSQALSDQLLEVVPDAEARPAYLRALYLQVFGHTLSGARARALACLAFIDAQPAIDDLVARGYDGLWRAHFTFMLTADLPAALALVQRCTRDLEESQVLYRLSLACTVEAFIWWGLGALEESERAARRARAIAEQVRDAYHAARATWYVGLALAEQTDPARLAEAEACASDVEHQVNAGFAAGVSRTLAARVALTRGDWSRAAREAEAARIALVGFPAFYFMASAHRLTALVRLGTHPADATAVAREDLRLLGSLGSPLCTEVLFRVAAAEALRAQDPALAQTVLREALGQVETRAALIGDLTLRRSFLERREENRRARELAREWARG